MRLAKAFLLSALLAVAPAFAHPMGNFSINHYSRLTVSAAALRLDYVLDLAEIPTFQELQAMGATPDKLPAASELQCYADRKAAEWATRLDLAIGGRSSRWRVVSARAEFAPGAGGLPTLKVYVKAAAPMSSGDLRYRDNNFPGRAGWKELVVEANGVKLHGAENFASDLSHGLTAYPADRAIGAPQTLTADFRVLPPAPVLRHLRTETPLTAAPKPQPAPPAPIATLPVPPEPKLQWGNIRRGDFLSTLMSGREIGWRLLLLGLAVAFCLGAFHALSPGHGKTIVAAYLVGSRGTIKHAVFLGGVVTFTHTIGVFALGLLVLLAGPRLVPERLYPWLGVGCGLSIVAIGAIMFRKRWAALSHHHHHHHHEHHDHPHDHAHDHHREHQHPHYHSHDLPDKVTLGNLLALGVSGGIIPCPSALVVLLAAISLNRAALGVLLILAFSLGLSVVLSSIGITMVQARSLFDRLPVNSALAQRLPVLSSAVVSALGLAIALQALSTLLPLR